MIRSKLIHTNFLWHYAHPPALKIWNLTIWGCLASLAWPISIPSALVWVWYQGEASYRLINVDSSLHGCCQKFLTQSPVPSNTQICSISLRDTWWWLWGVIVLYVMRKTSSFKDNFISVRRSWWLVSCQLPRAFDLPHPQLQFQCYTQFILHQQHVAIINPQ